MVKIRTLGDGNSEALKALFPETTEAKPLPVVKASTVAELKAGFFKEVVYELPIECFDLEDKIFATRTMHKPEEIDDMASSIKSAGQRQPIQARLDKQKAKLQIVMGWTRALACQVNGMTVKTQITDADARTCKAWALIENVQRNALTGWDQARKTIELLEEEYTIDEVAGFLGDVSQGHVYAIKNIFKFPLIVDALKTGQVNLSDSIHLANRTSSKGIPEDLQEKALKSFAAGTLKRKDLDYFLDKKGDLPAAVAPSTAAPGAVKKPKGKGASKSDKRKSSREGIEAYFQRFTDGKIQFTAKAVPGKTEVKELKKIQAAAVQFAKALASIIKKAK